MRKLVGTTATATPLTDRIENGANPEPWAPIHDEPLTAADIAHQLSGLWSELAAALEREEDRIDSELVCLGRAIVEITEPERWPRQMFRSEAARYLGISPDLLDDLVSGGHIAPGQAPGITQRVYQIETLDQYRNSTTQ